jgi:hypothetical protein
MLLHSQASCLCILHTFEEHTDQLCFTGRHQLKVMHEGFRIYIHLSHAAVHAPNLGKEHRLVNHNFVTMSRCISISEAEGMFRVGWHKLSTVTKPLPNIRVKSSFHLVKCFREQPWIA